MLKGLGGLGDIGAMMKSAKEMQSKMEAAQAEIAEMRVAGEAGGGLVQAVVTGTGELAGIEIDEGTIAPENKELIEDLLIAAIKDAQEKARVEAAEKMKSITDGMPLPEGFKLPF